MVLVFKNAALDLNMMHFYRYLETSEWCRNLRDTRK